MTKDLNALKEALENIEYKKRKFAKLSEELSSKRAQQKKSKEMLNKENKDVEKLDSLSFASFMATLLNNREEKLEKEMIEALEAKNLYDAISYEVQALNEELLTLDGDIAKEASIKAAYQEVYAKKKKDLSSQSVALWEKIRLLEIDFDEKNGDLKEIKEAESACSQTIRSIHIATKELVDAKAFGTWDLLGGGLVATMAKRNHMDRAQAAINDVNYKLKRLKKELSDINESVSLEIQMDNYLSFADYFFDGIFVDMMVQNKINEAHAKVSRLKNDMDSMHKRLKKMSKEIETQKSSLKNEIDKIILAHS